MAKELAGAAALSTGSRPVVPDISTIDHGHHLPRLRVQPMFLLIFSPSRWCLIDGRVVPQLSQIPVVAGTNGIEQGPGGKFKFARLLSRLETEGRILIPHAKGPGGSYVREVQTRTEAGETVPTHISAFATAHAGDNRCTVDSKAYADWLESLIADKVIPGPAPHRVRRMLRETESNLFNAEVALDAKPSAARHQLVRSLRRDVDSLRRLIGDEPTTEPVEGKAKTLKTDA